MTKQYCMQCAQELMITMRVCPSCGSKNLAPTPPVKATHTSPTPITQTNTPSVGILTAQAPLSVPTSTAATLVNEPASHMRRFFASVIDALIVGFGTGLLAGLAYLIELPTKGGSGLNPVVILMLLASLLVPYVYFTVLHGSDRRATIGKQVMGLALVTTQGEQVSKAIAFARIMLTALLPIAGLMVIGLSAAGMAIQYKEEIHSAIGAALVLAILIIYIAPFATVFFNNRHQTFFDMICKTCVIKNPNP
jgi:uncharacterized RDD family membrane protein YckC